MPSLGSLAEESKTSIARRSYSPPHTIIEMPEISISSQMSASEDFESPHKQYTDMCNDKDIPRLVEAIKSEEGLCADLHIKLAQRYREVGLYENAETTIQAAIDDLKTREGAYDDLMQAYITLIQIQTDGSSQVEEMEQTYDQAMELCDDDDGISKSALKNVKANYLMIINGDYLRALEYYQASIAHGVSALSDEGCDRYLALRKICVAQSNTIEVLFIYNPGQIPEHIEKLETYLKRYEVDINGRDVHLLHQDLQRKAIFLDTKTQLYEDCTTCFAYGNFHLYHNRFDEAIYYFRKGRSMQRCNPSLYFLEGFCHIRKIILNRDRFNPVEIAGIYAQAIKIFSKAFSRKHNPKHMIKEYRLALINLLKLVTGVYSRSYASADSYDTYKDQLVAIMASIDQSCYVHFDSYISRNIKYYLSRILDMYNEEIRENSYNPLRKNIEIFIQKFGTSAEVYRPVISAYLIEVFKTGKTSDEDKGAVIVSFFGRVDWLNVNDLGDRCCSGSSRLMRAYKKCNLYASLPLAVLVPIGIELFSHYSAEVLSNSSS